MPQYSVGYGVHRRGDEREAFMLVERTPWPVVAVTEMAEILCKLTRHHFCTLLPDDIYQFRERYTERFETPCTPEHASSFSHWRGWGRPFFMNEDGTQIPYDDVEREDYTRSP